MHINCRRYPQPQEQQQSHIWFSDKGWQRRSRTVQTQAYQA
jgi:hypothetical protein